MNKMSSMLHALLLSLMLVGGAQAATAVPAGKAPVAVTTAKPATPARHAKSSGKPMMKVNINTADAGAIHDALINIGPAKAAAIVAYRKQHGAFRSADQLAEVKGVGLKTIEKNRDRIVLGGAVAAAAPAKN